MQLNHRSGVSQAWGEWLGCISYFSIGKCPPLKFLKKKIVFIMGLEYLTTNLEEIINALQHSILSIDFIF